MVNLHVRPLIGWSERMRDLHAEIEKTLPTNLTVMIRGETGEPAKNWLRARST